MHKFKKYNVEATDENVKLSIQENKYDRAKSVKSFIEGLEMIDDNVSISLDAKWGEGKTFYVRQIEMTLKYLTKRKLDQDISDLEDSFSGSVLKNIILEKTYLPIYYNAWLYDNHNDPLLSLIYVILKECKKYISTTIDEKSLSDKAISLLSSLSLSLPFVQISGDFEKIKEDFQGKDLLKEIKTAEQSKELVKQMLDEVIVEEAQKLVIFIDELDRCKPSYAIEMLERVKHYFDDERIIFVMSVNKEQLVHSISNYYGDLFNATGYLNKFFDITVYLPEIPTYMKRNDILKINQEQYYLREIVEDLSEYFRLSLRDKIIFQQKIESTSKHYYNDTTAQGCMITMFVPIIIVLDIVDQSLRKKFVEGTGEIFKELCEKVSGIYKMICRFGDGNTNEEKFKEGFEKILEVYEYTFKGGKNNSMKLDVSRDLKDICVRVCNGE